MCTAKQDRLFIHGQQVIFETAKGEEMILPNLSALVKLYQENRPSELSSRIANLVQTDIGSLLIMETMMDMSHPVTHDRLKTGEISKTMKHVQDYYVILDSHIDDAKSLFEQKVAQGQLTGKFSDCHFAHFPFGLVIKRNGFKDYINANCDQSQFDAYFANN